MEEVQNISALDGADGSGNNDADEDELCVNMNRYGCVRKQN